MLRNLMFCIMHLDVMLRLSLIIDIWNCFKSEVVFFPVFPTLSVFPRTVFTGKYHGKNGYRPKPSNPANNWFDYRSIHLVNDQCIMHYIYDLYATYD